MEIFYVVNEEIKGFDARLALLHEMILIVELARSLILHPYPSSAYHLFPFLIVAPAFPVYIILPSLRRVRI